MPRVTNLSLCFRLIIQINAFSQSKGNNVPFDIWNGSGESINFTPSPQYNYPFLSTCFAPLFTILFTHTPFSKPCLIRINTARFNNCSDKIRLETETRDETRRWRRPGTFKYSLDQILSSRQEVSCRTLLAISSFIFYGENKIGGLLELPWQFTVLDIVLFRSNTEFSAFSLNWRFKLLKCCFLWVCLCCIDVWNKILCLYYFCWYIVVFYTL